MEIETDSMQLDKFLGGFIMIASSSDKNTESYQENNFKIARIPKTAGPLTIQKPKMKVEETKNRPIYIVDEVINSKIKD